MQRIDVRALRWLRLRLVLLGVGLGAVIVLLSIRAYRLQIKESDHLRRLAVEQYSELLAIPPRRGAILDRRGRMLAATVSVDSLAASPREIADPIETAARLAPILMLDPTTLAERLASGRDFAWIKHRLSTAETSAVGALALPGLLLAPESHRLYPAGALAGPVLGLVGSEGVGLEGLELSQEHWLRGSPGSARGLRDALGHVMLTDMPDTAKAEGLTVVTTLDVTIQFVAERALAAGVAAAHAKAGSLVALDPATGELLAIATVPGFDPNDAPAGPLARERPVTDAYEPGSTMKVFTVAAALDAGAIRPEDTFDGQQGAYRVGNYTIHDDEPHGLLPVPEVIQFSSNICAAKIAKRLGRERLEIALRSFGFGKATHVGLPGEAAGVLRPSARWGEIGLATIAFGQGLTVTPIQLVSALAAIAEGGVYRSPHILARVVDDAGAVEFTTPIEARRIMSSQTAGQLGAMLRLVTQKGGTAEGISPPGYPVAGKTGTAQRVDPATGRYGADRWVASFMGYVPADHPRLAMIVVVEEPRGTHLGGKVAGPIFSAVALQAMRILGVPPDPTALAATDLLAAAPASSDLANGDGGIAPSSEPVGVEAEGSDEPSQDGAIGVPDFTGMSIPEALRAANRANVKLEIVGSGRARGQSPGPGPATAGTVCRVAFAPPS